MLSRFGIAFAALIGLGAFTTAAPAPKYKPAKGSAELLKKMQGVWEYSLNNRIERLGLGGRPAAVQGLAVGRPSMRIRIEGDRWMYVREDRDGESRATTSYAIKIDASKKPVWLDLVRDATNTTYLQGIVAVEGDTMVFSYVSLTSTTIRGGDRAGRLARPRPTDFEPDGDSPRRTMTLRRVAKP